MMLRLVFAFSIAALSGLAAADTYPSKPIKLVVPYPAGGTTDAMARALQEPLRRFLGQPVIVENRPGAAGAIGAQAVARSAPDGYTILLGNNGPSAITPVLQKNAGFDAVKDFAPISMISEIPLLVVTHPSLPVKNVREFIDYAKANPGRIEYATAGSGSLGHLAGELFSHSAGIKMLHVPYNGQNPAVMAALGGETKMLLATASGALNDHIAAGKLKLIGVSAPSKLLPNVAPVSRDLPGYSVIVWFGLLAAAGTPPDVIAKLNDAVVKTVALPEFQEKYLGFGAAAISSTPKHLGDLIRDEVAKWSSIIKERNITSQ